MARARLLLVLHCHLPYVRHPEHEDFLEEDWLHEAVAETYVPLLRLLEGLTADGVPCRVTLSFSPTLCEMLTDELLGRRCARYLERHVALAEGELARTEGTPFAETARLYRALYGEAQEAWGQRGGAGLLAGFGELAAEGRVELIGSAATHALLPLVATPQARRAQVAVGLRSFRKHFGGRPRGFWLPECAYAPGLDGLLAGFGLGYFFLETHGLLLATPRPPLGVFAPLRTPAGLHAFGRDFASSHQVWSAEEGYPGDAAYREFHRDLGFDAEMDYLRPYLHADGVRRHLGLKYHRVTGDVPLGEKSPYRPREAQARARAHAEHFVAERLRQADRVRTAAGIDPIIVCPYDAELFGHWWFEGLDFLEAVLRLAAGRRELTWTTGAECLDAEPGPLPEQAGTPARSTWGDGGHFEVWVNGSNDWVYPRLHAAEREMAALVAANPAADGLLRRALNQCARELMLAQSGDWAFLMYAGTARRYATQRFEQLMGRFDELSRQLRAGRLRRDFLEQCERGDGAFGEMDYRVFAPEGARPGGTGRRRPRD
jgi:1,4-alpha-glucan branching enzyme